MEWMYRYGGIERTHEGYKQGRLLEPNERIPSKCPKCGKSLAHINAVGTKCHLYVVECRNRACRWGEIFRIGHPDDNEEVLNMSEFDEEKIKQFMHEKYPMFENNMNMGRILYAKAMKKPVNVPQMGKESVKTMTVDEVLKMAEGEKVCVKGLVVSKKQYEYEGCANPKCMKSIKKNCGCDAGTTTYKSTSFLLGDDTGMVWITGFGIPEEVMEGFTVQVAGKIKKFKGDMEVSAWNNGIEILDRGIPENVAQPSITKEPLPTSAPPQVKSVAERCNEIVKFVAESGLVGEAVFDELCAKAGVPKWEVMKHGLFVDSEGMVYKI